MREPRTAARSDRVRVFLVAALASVVLLTVVTTSRADRTPVKPGFNMFSTEQDVRLGQKYSREVARKLSMCDDPRIDDYLDTLGKTLAARAPGPKYPYQFKCVNDSAINAFALPGGFIYINRGTIESAENEAQLAGVIAHEIVHVALRHSTNQMSKQQVVVMPLSLLGGVMGNSAFGLLLTELGTSTALPVVFLKFSRTAESQADIVGTQMLYDSGFDPRALAQLFEKLEEQNKKERVRFLHDHPSPANRIERVQEEVHRLGGPPNDYKSDSREFQKIRLLAHDLPQPPPSKKLDAPKNQQNLTAGK
jgi:predicted Zn-dependent protease